MLKIIVPTAMLMPMTWLSKPNMIWINSTTYSLLISLISLSYLNQLGDNSLNLSLLFFSDSLSAPRLVLTTWLLPLMLMASQSHLSKETLARKKLYITMLIILQLLLIMTFTATELIMVYILFEATLIPTLIIITRWGNQTERLNAGLYFLFYTLVGSLPLLVALLYIQNATGTLNFLIIQSFNQTTIRLLIQHLYMTSLYNSFHSKNTFMRTPPVATKSTRRSPHCRLNSTCRCTIKTGGMWNDTHYNFTKPHNKPNSMPLHNAILWGMVMTSSICLRQTDLKSLIAYSSVSHMALVIVAVLIQTPWSYMGATALMIAHGLTSSVLFCLANSNYERVHSRTMILARGLQTILPLMAAWWLLASLANLALPPTINLIGELFVVMASFSWSNMTIVLMGTNIIITALYTLYMLTTTQRGKYTHHIKNINPSFTRENALMALLLPLLLLSLNPKIVLG
uniref:NADH-ubiquinone oxidoreductase chain 4 n=1 Tax=Panthera leo leo TaxID=1446311 RepID=W5VJ77_PANLE|nr:NADH dehydrogenase subunit 4 [Panthera leo leo]